jgi:hypothetical protein
MSRISELENLVKVKNELADKHTRLARAVKSKPVQAKHHRRAERFRQQAIILARQVGS